MNWLYRIWHLISYYFGNHSMGKARSGKWRAVEEKFLLANPCCAACGEKKWLNVHHCVPFHLDPGKELDMGNLITLCMGKRECHLRLGHGSDFKAHAPKIREYIIELHSGQKTFEEMIVIAKQERRYTL